MADTLWFFDVSLQCRKENGLIIYAKSKIGNKGNHAGKQKKHRYKTVKTPEKTCEKNRENGGKH